MSTESRCARILCVYLAHAFLAISRFQPYVKSITRVSVMSLTRVDGHDAAAAVIMLSFLPRTIHSVNSLSQRERFVSVVLDLLCLYMS